MDAITIRCPRCRTGTFSIPKVDREGVVCPLCSAVFQVIDGVMDLLPDVPTHRSPAQTLMEWGPLVRLYESRWWRRNFIFTALLGISFSDEVHRIDEAARFSPESTMLDLACGPGLYSRHFARQVPLGKVIGLDLSAPMLAQAAQLARAEQLENLHFLRADAMQLPLVEAQFDVVNCAAALHLFPSPVKALQEAYRVLKPGGRLTLAIVRRPSHALGRRVFQLGISLSGVHAFGDDELLAYLTSAGFTAVQIALRAPLWAVLSAEKRIDGTG